tara:strand:+ start:10992 stop:14369 length:3378 start_codon:yes stop_codon:yes gene_type:complete
MENKFKIKKGLEVFGSGGTLLDVQGDLGQLFSITDSLTGDLFSVSDISGVPILNVNSSGLVTIDGSLSLGDSDKIQFGASQDLQIYHDGSNSYIKDVGTGDLYIEGGNNIIFHDENQSRYIIINTSASVDLFYADVKKLETTNTGVTVTGEVLVGSGEYLSWGTSGATAIEGSTVSNLMRFYTDSTLAFTLDASQNATFAGNVTLGGGALQSYHANVTSALALDDQISVFTRANQMFLGNNFYYGASDGGIAIEADKSSLIQIDRDKVRFFFAASVSAGASASLQEKFRLDDTGKLTIPGEVEATSLDINGAADISGVLYGSTIVIDNTAGTRGIFRNNTGYDLRLGGGTVYSDGAYISLSGGIRGGGTTNTKGRVEIFSGGSNYSAQADITGDIVIGAQWNGGTSNILVLDSSTDNATFAGTLSAPFITASNANGAANGSPQEMARIVNVATGATSSYLYIGASSGTDWRLGKNINGTAGNTNFGITKHSGTDIFLGIDGTGNTSIHGGLVTGGTIQAGGAISSPLKLYHQATLGTTYVKIYRAEGLNSQISGIVRISGTSHGGSHVSNFTADVLVNHSGDILIKSISGNYTQVVLKVESDGNEDYHLSIKSVIATSTPTYYFTIEALTSELTITKAPTTDASTTATLEHTTKFGLNITGTGGNMTNGITGDLTLVGDLGAQGASFSGDITMSAASQIIFPDNSSVPDNPSNEQHDYLNFGANGSLSQVSGRGGLMLTSSDDSLVLANGDVGRSFVAADLNVDAEEIYILSDNSVQIKTDLQDGYDGSPTAYYTHQFLGGEHTRANSTGGSVSFLHTGSENVMRYKGIVAGDWDTIFSTTDGHMGIYEVQNIVAGTGSGAHSNYPTGAYSYGGVLSWQLANSTFKLYAPHTGTLWYQTGWNNDEYTGWRKIWDSGNDGTGSGLDADTVDGIQGASFLRSDTADTATGALTISAHLQFGNCTVSKSGDNNHIHVNCPTALIPNSTTLANNTALGTSSYRWKTFHAGPGNFLGSVTASADVVAYSDIKLKENIKTLDGSKVLEMRGVSFDRKDNGASSSGVIAQEMQKVAPELVSDDAGTLGVAYGNLTGYLIEAIKEQQKQINELKSQMATCNKTTCNCNCNCKN